MLSEKLRSKWKKMDYDERIIKYIENELTADEKIQFELDLKKSEQLKEQLNKYLLVNSRIQETKTARLSQVYRDKILPELRQRIQRENIPTTRRNLNYAFGMITVSIVSFIFLQNIFRNDSQINSVQEFTESLNEQQKIELLENLNGDIEDYSLVEENIVGIELANLIQTNLTVDNEIAEAYNISYPDLINEIDKAEAEKIFEQILKKNFS